MQSIFSRNISYQWSFRFPFLKKRIIFPFQEILFHVFIVFPLFHCVPRCFSQFIIASHLFISYFSPRSRIFLFLSVSLCRKMQVAFQARPPKTHETLDRSKAAEQMSRCIKSRPSYKPVVHIGEGREKAKTGRNFAPALIQRINCPSTLQPDAATTTLDFRLASPVRLTVSLSLSHSMFLRLFISRSFSSFLLVLHVPLCFCMLLSVSLCFLLFRTCSLCFALFRSVSPRFVLFRSGLLCLSLFLTAPFCLVSRCFSLFLSRCSHCYFIFLVVSPQFSSVLSVFTVHRSVSHGSILFLSSLCGLHLFLFLFLESGEGTGREGGQGFQMESSPSNGPGIERGEAGDHPAGPPSAPPREEDGGRRVPSGGPSNAGRKEGGKGRREEGGRDLWAL